MLMYIVQRCRTRLVIVKVHGILILAKKLFSKINSTKMDEEPTDNDPESIKLE